MVKQTRRTESVMTAVRRAFALDAPRNNKEVKIEESVKLLDPDIEAMALSFHASIVEHDDKRDPEAKEAISTWEMKRVARELLLSVDDVLAAKNIFDRYDENHDGLLEIPEFEAAIMKLMDVPCLVPEQKLGYWWHKNTREGKNPEIDFPDFVRWISANGFHQDWLLRDSERCIRKYAKQYGVSAELVENVKHVFDTHDIHKCGMVSIAQFTTILRKAFRLQPDQELPASRVRYFWKEMTKDDSDTVMFHAFLVWWLKSVNQLGDLDLKPEMFYQQFRQVHSQQKMMD